MVFVFGFFITGLLFLAFFFVIVYGVIAFLLKRLMQPLQPTIQELKKIWNNTFEDKSC